MALMSASISEVKRSAGQCAVAAAAYGARTKLNWYPKVQILQSSKNYKLSEVRSFEEGKLGQEHLAFFNWDDVFFEIEKLKNERSWYNLNLSKENLKNILEQKDWYILYIPKAELEVKNYKQVQLWQEVGTVLLKSAVERIYNYQRSEFEKENLEVVIVGKDNPNFIEEYLLAVKQSEEGLIRKIKELKDVVEKKEFKKSFPIEKDFNAIFYDRHLYLPLLYLGSGYDSETIKIKPLSLNKGESDFIEDLKIFHKGNEGFFKDKELYLLRNRSRKGIGFFEANNFYPDFILWLVQGKKQHLAFIDPKGLRQVQGFSDEKIQLHETIKSKIQPSLAEPDIELSSFIISNTLFTELSHWKGQNSIQDFNKKNIFFQGEQRGEYISLILKLLHK